MLQRTKSDLHLINGKTKAKNVHDVQDSKTDASKASRPKPWRNLLTDASAHVQHSVWSNFTGRQSTAQQPIEPIQQPAKKSIQLAAEYLKAGIQIGANYNHMVELCDEVLALNDKYKP